MSGPERAAPQLPWHGPSDGTAPPRRSGEAQAATAEGGHRAWLPPAARTTPADRPGWSTRPTSPVGAPATGPVGSSADGPGRRPREWGTGQHGASNGNRTEGERLRETRPLGHAAMDREYVGRRAGGPERLRSRGGASSPRKGRPWGSPPHVKGPPFTSPPLRRSSSRSLLRRTLPVRPSSGVLRRAPPRLPPYLPNRDVDRWCRRGAALLLHLMPHQRHSSCRASAMSAESTRCSLVQASHPSPRPRHPRDCRVPTATDPSVLTPRPAPPLSPPGAGPSAPLRRSAGRHQKGALTSGYMQEPPTRRKPYPPNRESVGTVTLPRPRSGLTAPSDLRNVLPCAQENGKTERPKGQPGKPELKAHSRSLQNSIRCRSHRTELTRRTGTC